MTHQTRLNIVLNYAIKRYRTHYPDLTQAEARAALQDAITDLPETVPDGDGAMQEDAE